MKKFFSLIAVFLVTSGISLFAGDFDWSKCWCNYGGGIQKGDIIMHVDAGLNGYVFKGSDYWALPYTEFTLSIAEPIWKLPFTFGGYVGMNAYGWKGSGDSWSRFVLRFGGDATYHIQLPPKNLDVYTGVRLGAETAINHDEGVWPEVAFTLGANWFFTNKLGVNLEFGAPVWLKGGLSIKL